MKKKYIFLDIDGTLFDQNTYSIPSSAIKAIMKAKENGHELFLCTGRPYPSVLVDFKDLPIDSFVLCGGEHIVIHHKTVFNASFPSEKLKSLISSLLDKKIGFMLEGCNYNFISDEIVDLFKKILNLNTIDEFKKHLFFPIHEIKPSDYTQVLKISIFTKQFTITKEVIDHISEDLHGFIYPYVEHGEYHHGEIYVKGYSKASGIDQVLSYYNASIEDTIAIGDALNDLEMIEHCDIGIAMGNACKELKEKADYITDTIDNDGIYNAFKHFNLI